MEKELEELFNAMFAAGGVLLHVLYVFIAIFVVFLIVYIIGLVKFFKKCDKPGWAAIIPYYNVYVLNEIADLNWWWFLIYMVAVLVAPYMLGQNGVTLSSLILLFVRLNIGYNTAIKFGKKDDWLWIILAGLFGKVFYACVGLFGSSKYDKNAKVFKNGFFKDN